MRYLFLLFYTCFISPGFGQTHTIDKALDELLSPQFKASHPGCEVLVAKQGKILYHKSFGSAEIELNVPLTTGMVFKLASITKQFTAVAILQLVEQQKISLGDSLQKFIPGFPSKGHTITIEQLLTHTSGIPDFMQIDYQQPNMERRDFTPTQLIDSFKNYPLQFVPGSKYVYSNSGYFLLGYIIEKTSGKTYQQYIEDNLLKPLALTHSYFDDGSKLIPGRVKGYRIENGIIKNADYWSSTIAYAAGGLLSNSEDLLKWFNGLLSYKILKKETLDKAFTQHKLSNGTPINYGYGWYIINSGNTSSIEHAGKMNGFITNQVYYPEQGIFIAALFNSENAKKDELSIKIAEIALGQPLQKQAVKPTENILQSYIGTYVLSIDAKRKISIVKEKDKLLAQLPGQDSFEILFQTSTQFSLKNITDAKGEFISRDGIVSKIIIDQNGRYEWIKHN